MKNSTRMIRFMNKWVLAILMLVSVFLIRELKVAAYTAHTQAEAIQWLDSKVGSGIDADGAHGNQCVDLILAYYDYLGVPRSDGNAVEYTTNTVPSGWQRIQGASPQPGDILVYTGGVGHVAIMGNSGATYHQNFGYNPKVEKITYIAYNGFSNPYWGVIRPDFTSATVPDITAQVPNAAANADGVMTVQFNAVSNATYYDIVLFDTNKNEIDYKNIGNNTRGTMQLPRTGVYYVKIYAYNGAGRTMSQETQVLWSTERIAAVESGTVGIVKSQKGSYWYASTVNNELHKRENIDYSCLENYLFKFIKLNSDNEYVIYSMKNNKVLTFEGNLNQSGNALSLRDYTGAGNQRFVFKKPTTGTGHVIMLINSRLVMDEESMYQSCVRMCWFSSYENPKQYYSIRKMSGWVTDNGNKYYITDKRMTGWGLINDNWYYFNTEGIMQIAWQFIDNIWYYLNQNGVMQTGWQLIGSTWYYFNGSGSMMTGWQVIGGTWYYFNGNGAMVTGWQVIGGTWYYFNGSGAMVTGWQLIGGKWYYFHGSGTMLANEWMGNYYLQSDGSMATNKWIGRYYVGADGCWIS